jgi:translation initiation factor IF-1
MLEHVLCCKLYTKKNEEYEYEAKVSGICANSEYKVQLKEKKVHGHVQDKRKAM